jgi:hypothetical protein
VRSENEDCRADLSRRSLGEGGSPLSDEGGRWFQCNNRSKLRPGKPVKAEMDFSYVYILQSKAQEERFYIGMPGILQTGSASQGPV